MMYPNTSSFLFARRILPEARHGIAFVGFLDPDSPGHRVARAALGETVDLGGEAGPVRVACSVRRFGFTAHSRASQLLATVERLRPRRVVLVHGDSEATEAMCRQLAVRGVETTIAEAGMTVEL
jgi:predicted metal-dependent RNase